MKKDRKEILRAFSLFTQLGLSMAACVLIGVLGGYALDKWTGLSPLFLLIGALLGAGAAFKVMYDMVIKDWLNS